MKTYFDVHGSLVVEGENATEWLALRTWAERWSADRGPLIVKWLVAARRHSEDGTRSWTESEPEIRQLFRSATPLQPPQDN